MCSCYHNIDYLAQHCVASTLDQKRRSGFKIILVDIDEDRSSSTLSYRRQLDRCDAYSSTPSSFDPDSTVVLPFSSGTTGPPKGVELTQRNLVANVAQLVYGEGFDFLPFPTGN